MERLSLFVGTFNAFSFNEMNYNITLDKALKIANGIVRRLGID